MRSLALLAIIGLATTSALGQEPKDCLHAPAILAAADFLLTEPAVKPNFWRDNTGDDAAYLKLHYGDLTYSQGAKLLETLQQRTDPPQRILELRLAYAKTPDRMGLLVTIPERGNRGSVLDMLGESAWYALALEDGDWLFDELTRWQKADSFGFKWSTIHMKLPEALADMHDETKSRLAKRAEDAGAWRMALNLLALKTDLTEYLSYLDRLPQEYADKNLSKPEQRERWIADALSLNFFRPAFDISAQPAEVQAVDRKRDWNKVLRQLGKLAVYAPDTAILLTVLNQTGEIRLGSTVAFTLNSQIEAGQLDPVNEPDALIAAMVVGLDLVLGRRAREQILAAFAMSGMQGETPAEFVDRALARLALGPFMRGEVASPPSRPGKITQAFDWDRWVALAGKLKTGDPVVPEDGMIAAELLIAADRSIDALAALTTATDWKTTRLRVHRMMRTLDTRCNKLLSHPIPTSEPLYRFGPR